MICSQVFNGDLSVFGFLLQFRFVFRGADGGFAKKRYAKFNNCESKRNENLHCDPSVNLTT